MSVYGSPGVTILSTGTFVNLADYENEAKQTLPRVVRCYYAAGAGDELTLKENEEAYRRIKLRPRILRDVSSVTYNTQWLGAPVSMPIGIAPTAMQCMAHPDGELATVRAAVRSGVCMILSTLSTVSMEDIAMEANREYEKCKLKNPDHPRPLLWYQLYLYKDREISYRLIKRAEQVGCSALVLTVDTPILGQRESDRRFNFSMPKHLKLANFIEFNSPLFRTKIPFEDYVHRNFDASMSWRDFEESIRPQTQLPILLKGIHTIEDARLAKSHRVQGIIISNHGARQLDTVEATIDILPQIVQGLNHDTQPVSTSNTTIGSSSFEIYLDGGVRRGIDVLKALSLGARGVFIGRPILWGLACRGEAGVENVLEMLGNEFSSSMILSGCPSLDHINRNLVTISSISHL